MNCKNNKLFKKIRYRLLILTIFFIFLSNIPVFAHLPSADEVNPEIYQPTLGWVDLIEGDVVVKDVEGNIINIKEGDPIKGDFSIETGDESQLVLKLEDFEDHQSIMTIDYNSKMSFDLSEGKHYNDTIKPYRWYIDRHSVSLNMERGHLYMTLNINSTEEYELQIKTPNSLIHNTLGWKEKVDFFVTIEEDVSPGAIDMTDQMQEYFNQMQEMAGEKADDEMKEEFSNMTKEYNEMLNMGMDSEIMDIDEHGITTKLDVYSGEAKIHSNTRAGSSDNIFVEAGHSATVSGLNPPLLDGDEVSSTENEEKPQRKPTLDLNIELDESKSRPDLADNLKTQLRVVTSEEGESGMPGVPPEMLKTSVWVYKVEGNPETILEDGNWPQNTSKNVEEKNLGEEIFNLVDNFGYALDEVWGKGWSVKAERAAAEYDGRKFTSVTYSYMIPPVKSYTVNVVSTWLDPKTLKLYEGTYLMIIELDIDYGF